MDHLALKALNYFIIKQTDPLHYEHWQTNEEFVLLVQALFGK